MPSKALRGCHSDADTRPVARLFNEMVQGMESMPRIMISPAPDSNRWNRVEQCQGFLTSSFFSTFVRHPWCDCRNPQLPGPPVRSVSVLILTSLQDGNKTPVLIAYTKGGEQWNRDPGTCNHADWFRLDDSTSGRSRLPGEVSVFPIISIPWSDFFHMLRPFH